MNASQMQMLSVKSAIERTVSGLIVSYATNPSTAADNMYNDVCRYMASLFASQQIDRDYRVELLNNNLSVAFWSRGNSTSLSFLLPYKIPKQPEPQPLTVEIEELGEPFKKILDENRWDLYETEPSVYVE